MKHRERMNAIVKRLYELKDDRYSHALTDIMKDLDIYESDDDMRRMATRLEDEKLADLTSMKGGIDVEITNHGIDYYDEYLSSSMGEAGKLMAILKWLYDRRHKGSSHTRLEAIMEELGIYESDDEAERLVDEMVDGNLVALTRIEDGTALIRQITNKGIKHLKGEATGNSERESSGQQIIFKGDFHAVNAAIGDNSQIQQTATINSQTHGLIHKIREGIKASPEIDQEQKNDLLDSVSDIEKSLKSKEKVPAYQWKNLIGNAANVTQVAGFIMELAKQNGFQFPSI